VLLPRLYWCGLSGCTTKAGSGLLCKNKSQAGMAPTQKRPPLSTNTPLRPRCHSPSPHHSPTGSDHHVKLVDWCLISKEGMWCCIRVTTNLARWGTLPFHAQPGGCHAHQPSLSCSSLPQLKAKLWRSHKPQQQKIFGHRMPHSIVV